MSIRCQLCQFVKAESDFYASNQRTCKECVKASVRDNRLSRIEYYRAYDRGRGNRQGFDYLKKYRESNKSKYLAHNKVNNAVRDGKLKKEPCELCGKVDSHAHHDDYSKPLEVRWLCAAHHRQWHVENGEAANAS